MHNDISEQELFSTLLQTIPDQIYFKDRKGRFLRLSAAVAAGFGKADPAEVIGKSDYDFFPTSFADEAAADEHRVMATGQPMVGKIERVVKPGGRISWNYSTKVPLRNRKGEIIGICGINKDITAMHEMEEALREERNRLLTLTAELQTKNAQMAADIEMAREIQEALLPREYPVLKGGCGGFSFAHVYRPAASVSGDFYDFFQLSPSRAGIFICDVMGHGVRASLITTMIRGLLEDLRPIMGNPGLLMQQVNAHLRSILKKTGDTVLATAFYVVVDAERQEICFANAAHPQPVLLRKSGAGAELPACSSQFRPAALGLFDHAEFPTGQCSFDVGDRLILFTDGLFEIATEHGEEFSCKSVIDSLVENRASASGTLLREVSAAALRFAGKSEFEDDVCLVAIERTEPGSA